MQFDTAHFDVRSGNSLRLGYANLTLRQPDKLSWDRRGKTGPSDRAPRWRPGASARRARSAENQGDQRRVDVAVRGQRQVGLSEFTDGLLFRPATPEQRLEVAERLHRFDQ